MFLTCVAMTSKVAVVALFVRLVGLTGIISRFQGGFPLLG